MSHQLLNQLDPNHHHHQCPPNHTKSCPSSSSTMKPIKALLALAALAVPGTSAGPIAYGICQTGTLHAFTLPNALMKYVSQAVTSSPSPATPRLAPHSVQSSLPRPRHPPSSHATPRSEPALPRAPPPRSSLLSRECLKKIRIYSCQRRADY
jgi:hypothetical protein